MGSHDATAFTMASRKAIVIIGTTDRAASTGAAPRPLRSPESERGGTRDGGPGGTPAGPVGRSLRHRRQSAGECRRDSEPASDERNGIRPRVGRGLARQRSGLLQGGKAVDERPHEELGASTPPARDDAGVDELVERVREQFERCPATRSASVHIVTRPGSERAGSRRRCTRPSSRSVMIEKRSTRRC